jgi:hypothetical protein
VASFNTRTGAVTLTSGDVTTALGDTHIAFLDATTPFSVAQTVQGQIKATNGTNYIFIDPGVQGSSSPMLHLFYAGVSDAQITVDSPHGFVFNLGASFAGAITTTAAFQAPQLTAKDASNPYVQIWLTGVHIYTWSGATAGYIKLLDTSGNQLMIARGEDNAGGIGFTDGHIGIGPASLSNPGAKLHVLKDDAVTNAVSLAYIAGHKSSGTPAAGFGVGLQLQLDSSTTANRLAGQINTVWSTATDASRAGQMQAGVYDAATVFREGWRIDTDGTGANMALWGAGSYGGGRCVFFINNATVNPTSNPTGGGILYSNAGAGTWRGSSGTITAFGPAGPHCGNCGYDHWRAAFRNDTWGSYLYECGMCGKVYKRGPASVLDRLNSEQLAELLT